MFVRGLWSNEGFISMHMNMCLQNITWCLRRVIWEIQNRIVVRAPVMNWGGTQCRARESWGGLPTVCHYHTTHTEQERERQKDAGDYIIPRRWSSKMGTERNVLLIEGTYGGRAAVGYQHHWVSDVTTLPHFTRRALWYQWQKQVKVFLGGFSNPYLRVLPLRMIHRDWPI